MIINSIVLCSKQLGLYRLEIILKVAFSKFAEDLDIVPFLNIRNQLSRKNLKCRVRCCWSYHVTKSLQQIPMRFLKLAEVIHGQHGHENYPENIYVNKLYYCI